jgi:hypothetical protein
VRRGAASCRAVWRGRAAQRVSPVARMSGRRPGRSLPVRLVRSAVGMSVRPVERTSSVHASGVRCPGVRASRCPAGHALVSAALPPPCPRAGPRSGSVAGRPGRAQRVDVPPWSVGGVGACPHRAAREAMARRLPVPARRRVDPSQGRRLAGVPAAAPPWPRRADTGAGPGSGIRPGGGEPGTEQVLTGPSQGVLGRSPAWCPAIGLDQEVVTTLGGRWARGGPVATSSGGPPRFGGGAACGRGAAAAREERCLLGADRSLTSENSGGRDRV